MTRTVGTWLLALLIGSAFSTVCLLIGVQHLFPTESSALLGGLLACGFTVIAQQVLTRFLIPNWLLQFPGWARGVLLLVAVGMGIVLVTRSPFDLSAIDSINFIALLIVGGALTLTVLFGVVGTKKPLHPRFIIVSGLLIAYVVAGLWVYDDYGLSTDELTQRRHGEVSTRYIFELADVEPFATQLQYVYELDDYPWKSYGVAFQLPVTVFEVINDLSFPTILLYRHYVTFLFFVVGVLAFYRLATESLGHWLYGVVGTLFFILTPRIFAESFYNPKDTIFLAAFTVALYFGFRYWRSKSIVMGGVFGLAAAFAMNIRVVAVGLVALVIAMVLFDLWQAGATFFNTRSRLQKLSVLVLMFCLVAMNLLLAPASWSNPVQYLMDVFSTFKDYNYWDQRIMYWGEHIRGQTLPWHFLPVWMVITIPVGYLLLFSVGVGRVLIDSLNISCMVRSTKQREGLVYLLLLVVPILFAIVNNITLYSGWRHFTFVYAPFLMVALYGVRTLVQGVMHLPSLHRYWVGVLLGSILLLYQVYLVGWMVRQHPYQMVYFNPIVNVFGGRANFERDYWYLSVRQAIEYILAHDNRDDIVIYGNNTPFVNRQLILPIEQQRRLTVVLGMSDSVDYVVNMHRSPPGYYPAVTLPVYHTIDVDGLTIATIYKAD